jgi:hypothetical protein
MMIIIEFIDFHFSNGNDTSMFHAHYRRHSSDDLWDFDISHRGLVICSGQQKMLPTVLNAISLIIDCKPDTDDH